jgi:116 kDa U5 small nuclear ribonucleoprotein component
VFDASPLTLVPRVADLEPLFPLVSDSPTSSSHQSLLSLFFCIDAAPENLQRAVVLHEDKKYYADAEDVFKGAEVTVQEEDTQPITEPIIKSDRARKYAHADKQKDREHFPPTTFTRDFFEGMMHNPTLTRHVALIGSLHHGKTAFTDMLVHATHEGRWDIKSEKSERFTDVRLDEQQRGLSIKSNPVSLVLPSTRDKSYLVNILDTPGHINFSDEVTAALRIADGAVVIVDACEGVMLNTERLIRHAIQEQLAITVVINKFDRLILELKLPPTDAFYKLRHILDEINDILEDCGGMLGGDMPLRVSPELGNVVFASSDHDWSFSLRQFAQVYSEVHGSTFDIDAFAKRLWGDWWFDNSTRKFVRKAPDVSASRSFVQFILEPIWKVYSYVVGEEEPALRALLENELGIFLRREDFGLDVKPLLRLVMGKFLGKFPSGFVDMLVQHVPAPNNPEYLRKKIEHIYSGPLDTRMAKGMLECSARGPLMIHTTKLYHSESESGKFYAFGRVFSGTIKLGERVKVLGEAFDNETNDEDQRVEDVTGVYTFQSRYRIDHTVVPAGNWVLLEGVDASIFKTSTISTHLGVSLEELFVFRSLRFNTNAVMKMSIEPLNPAELPKMVEGLRRCDKTYPLLKTKVEESGEHVLLGTGELYMDCVLYDLRKIFADIEIRVSDAVVSFCETVVETSSLKCFAETSNKKNKLTLIAEPLEPGLAEDIEQQKISLDWEDKKAVRSWFQKNYDWDVMATRNLWAFGPDRRGPNLLLNDTLPTEVDQQSLNAVKDSVVQGFDWASREGPLCEEPIRNVKFKILHAAVAGEQIARAPNYIIPASRRACYSAFLTATPRLMEPVYLVEIIAPADCSEAVYNVLARRRGRVSEAPKPRPGTPLYTIKAFIPVIDSFGFETDLRTHTQGMAFCMSVFDHWAVVPGDPLDKSIVLRPLEAATSADQLARDFMIKTRRRKGLSEDVSVHKFFDEELLAHLKALDINIV